MRLTFSFTTATSGLKPWSSECEDYEYGHLRCEATVWYVCTTTSVAPSVCAFREEEEARSSSRTLVTTFGDR